jgi:predicted nucleotidyltransferase
MIKTDEKEALHDFAAIASQNDVPIVIVGASARLLIFDSRYDIRSTRTTGDWDIAVQVADWKAFKRLEKALTAGKIFLFSKGQSMHRFRHIRGVEIDIIPFGGVEEEDGTIVWPQEDQQMNVLGFHEVYLSAERYDIGGGLVLPVATPSGLAVLKIFAYNDRRHDDDIRDFYFILEHYDRANNEERIYDELSELLGDGKLDYESAKAYLLGIDIRRLISQRTLDAFLQILDRLELLDPYSPHLAHLIIRLGSQREEERKRHQIANLFKGLRAGLTHEF